MVDELKRYREEKRKLEEQMTIIRRTKFFEDLHFQLIGKRDSILHLSGVNFTRFNHEIIVFIFKPSSLPSILARDATEFKTVLKYNRNYWKVSSCSKGHLGIKQKFYQWSAQRNIQDAGIVQFIISLYNELVSWYTEHTKYLLGRQKVICTMCYISKGTVQYFVFHVKVDFYSSTVFYWFIDPFMKCEVN